MNDHPEDAATWAAHHADWSAFADRFVAVFRTPFETLHAIQYDAPWQRTACHPARAAIRRAR